MADEERAEVPPEFVEMPAPTPWPMLAALGLTLSFAGLVTHMTVSVVGLAIAVVAAVGWFREVLPREHREEVAVGAEAAAIAAVKVPVERLRIDMRPYRTSLPVEIYPYSAGLRGGIAGGAVMAVLAGLEGIILHGSPWYTINILAATVMPDLAHADTATLCHFIGAAFAMALLIHSVLSLLMGLLYGVMLPMLPRYPIVFGGVIAPLLWTGLIWSSLNVLNPLLDARIEWRWFFLCQVAFGLTAGIVTARSERIKTLQHLPLAYRSGLEAPGLERGERDE